MKDETFVDKVRKQFEFLETQYGFNIAFKNNSEIRPQTDGTVKYTSDTTLISIDSETGQVAVKFIRIQDDEMFYLDPVIIHEYLKTSDDEKQVLLSKDVTKRDPANAISRRVFLLSSPDWIKDRTDISKNLEKQLTIYANWLRENPQLCLMGDFSRWPEFYEYKINRLMADELRRGARETVMAIVRDENGNLKTTERSIFQREKEYLAKLRKEGS